MMTRRRRQSRAIRSSWFCFKAGVVVLKGKKEKKKVMYNFMV
jgi:hypothetical protein